MLALAAHARADTRHLMIPVNIAFLASAVVLASLIERCSRRVRWVTLVAIMMIALGIWLPFAITLYTAPANLPLSADEYQQYLASEGSGSGMKELATILTDLEPKAVLGIFANCWALEYMVGDRLPLECPSINPNGSTVAALAELMANNQSEGVYAVLENLSYLPASAPGRLVTTIARPKAGPSLKVYHLVPN